MSRDYTILICVFVLCTFSLFLQYRDSALVSSSFASTKGFLTVDFSKGRLANQIFHLLDGYALSRDLNRQFYIRYSADNDDLDAVLEKVFYIFPKLKNTYVIITKEIEEKSVAQKFSHRLSSNLVNAQLWEDEPAEYLHVNLWYGQNWNYFGKYEEDVRKLLEFSAEIQEYAQEIINIKELSDDHSYLCVHIRRTDFAHYHAESLFESSYAMTEMVLKHQRLKRVAIFGDDDRFMHNIVNALGEKHLIENNGGFVSGFSQGMDLYLSSRLCHSFLITAPVSTFGFWLGYLSPNQNSVFYRKDERIVMSKSTGRHIFPPGWQPLDVVNETIVSLAD